MNAVSIWWLLVVVLKIIYVVNANWITGNLCWSMPCMNGGSCFGTAYTYLCICPIQYSGALCEKRIGVCQENPCGNRGLCIETSLTSFECRCYYDYMGPTCEEHVKKNEPSIWSSLLPVHTQLLFDMLQEAYHAKSNRKSLIDSENDQIDFIGLLSTPATSTPIISTTVPPTFTPITSTTVPPAFTPDQSETTETELIIQAHDIQLDKIFPDISTVSKLDINTYEVTEQSLQFDNPNTSDTNMITTTMIIETMTTTPTEQIQPDFFNNIDNHDLINISEQPNIMITSTPVQWSNDKNIIDDITAQNLIKETNNSTDSTVITTIKPIDSTSANITITIDDDKFYSSDQTITSSMNTLKQPLSTNTITTPQTIHSHLLSKLCNQDFSHILPTTSSSSSSNSSSNVFVSWLNKHLHSSTSTTTTSTVPSLIINKSQASSIPLQRIDMDDRLHQMSNNIYNEH